MDIGPLSDGDFRSLLWSLVWNLGDSRKNLYECIGTPVITCLKFWLSHFFRFFPTSSIRGVCVCVCVCVSLGLFLSPVLSLFLSVGAPASACVCVCVYVSAYVFVCVYMCVYVYVCCVWQLMVACGCVCLCVSVCVYLHVCGCTDPVLLTSRSRSARRTSSVLLWQYLSLSQVDLCKYIFIRIHIYINVCMYICIYVCVYIARGC